VGLLFIPTMGSASPVSKLNYTTFVCATRRHVPGGVNGPPWVDINCAVIGWTGDKPPLANLADPVANSQFPPR
jgi:hypothetical protein